MKFSIIIPAHNEEHTISMALQSIKNQSYTDYEVIVVCDNCNDHTKGIAQMFGAKVLEIEGGSSAAARNAGLDVAQGDWVLFCDADDWYLHEFVLEQLTEKIDEQPSDTSVIIFALIWRHIGYGKVRSPKGTIYPHVANKCWRRSSIGETRFPEDVKVAEDGHFFNQMMAKGLKATEWDMPLYYYNYLNPGSKSSQLGRSASHTKEYWSRH